MRFGTLYRSGSLSSIHRKLARYKLDLVGAHEVRWDMVGHRGHGKNRGITFFFNRKGNENHQLGTGVCVQHRVASAVKRVEFVSGRMLYIVPRGRWCNIVVLNVHAPSEERSDDSKRQFL